MSELAPQPTAPQPVAASPDVQALGQVQVLHGEQIALPVPPPDLLAEYEKLHPGATKLFFSDWQAESAARRDHNRKAVDANILAQQSTLRGVARGQWLVFGVSVGSMVCGTWIALAAPGQAAAIIAALFSAPALVNMLSAAVPVIIRSWPQRSGKGPR